MLRVKATMTTIHTLQTPNYVSPKCLTTDHNQSPPVDVQKDVIFLFVWYFGTSVHGACYEHVFVTAVTLETLTCPPSSLEPMFLSWSVPPAQPTADVSEQSRFWSTALVLCLLGLALIWLTCSLVSSGIRKWLKHRKRIIEPTSGSQSATFPDGKVSSQHQTPQKCRLKCLDTFRG